MTFEFGDMQEAEIPTVSVLLLRLFERYIAHDFSPGAQAGIRQYLTPQALRARWGICHFALVCRVPSSDAQSSEAVQARSAIALHASHLNSPVAQSQAANSDPAGTQIDSAQIDSAQIVGMIEVREYRHISLLFVDDGYQRRGIARALLTRAIDRCLNRIPDLPYVTVRASPFAVPVYERLGFVPHPELDEVNSPALAMRLPLNSLT